MTVATGVFALVLLAGSLLIPVTTINQSGYPWLTPGAYAQYENELGDPGFVLPNGTYLSSFGIGCPCTANAILTWSVVQRAGSSVFIVVNYSVSGREVVFNSSSFTAPIVFNFSTSLDLRVDVQTGMAYLHDEPIGIIGFWSVPLPSKGENVTFGTDIVDGKSYNVSGTVGGFCGNCGIGATVNGVPFTGTLKQYSLDNSVFAHTPSFIFEGRNYTETGPGPCYCKLEPADDYDYYNGLALVLSGPKYPVSETVCNTEGNTTTNCHLATFSTALGKYLRSYGYSLYLSSTNISLLPGSENASQPTLNWGVIVVAMVVVVGVSYPTYRWLRKRRAVGETTAEADVTVQCSGAIDWT